jgi:hypothetical protein
VKIDLLGNRSLAVIRDAVANVKANGIIFDENRWEPEDNPATRDTVAKGRTMGCFYIESPAMRLLHQKAGSGDFDHLVIHSSIIRPAANVYIQGVPEAPARRQLGSHPPAAGRRARRDLRHHGLPGGCLPGGQGSLAGFSDAEADGLRKIIAKKDRQRQLADFTTVSWPAPLPGVFPRTRPMPSGR